VGNLLQGLRGTFEVDGNINHALSVQRDRLDKEDTRQTKLLGRAAAQAPAVLGTRTPAAAQPHTSLVAEQLDKLEQQLLYLCIYMYSTPGYQSKIGIYKRSYYYYYYYYYYY
jgi:hypothetical protein